MPRSFAASTRPCPAMICPPSSIRIGLVWPKRSMLLGNLRICVLEWARALPEYGVAAPVRSFRCEALAIRSIRCGIFVYCIWV